MRKFIPLLALAPLMSVPLRVLAQGETSDIQIDPCATPNLSCASDIVGHIFDVFINSNAVFIAFSGLLFTFFVYSGLQLATEARTENVIRETVAAFSEAIMGAIMVSGAFMFAQSFTNPAEIVNPEPAMEVLQGVIAFLVRSVGFVLLANIMIQGVRLILAINEGTLDVPRKHFVMSLFGGALVMLTVPIVSLILPGTFNGEINDEIVGVANFLGTIFGAAAVLSVIIAGILLMISVSDSLKERAKSMIINTIVALIVVVAAVAIIQVLLPTADSI